MIEQKTLKWLPPSRNRLNRFKGAPIMKEVTSKMGYFLISRESDGYFIVI